MSLDRLPVGIFDFILAAILVAGVFRGRKHGMSEECLSLLKWLAVAFGSAKLYLPLGRLLARACPFSPLASFMIAYAGSALLILSLFALLKHAVGGKMVGSDLFGRAEYYLGMGSGLARFACMAIALLALLNARHFSPAEVQASLRYQNDVYGSNFFPSWHSAQQVVFEKSFSGAWIQQHLAFLLIKPSEAPAKPYQQREWGAL